MPIPGESPRRQRSLRAWGLIVVGAVVLIALVVTAVQARGTPAHDAAARATFLHPPSALYATGTQDGAVLLSWQPSRPAPVGYRIYRAAGRHGPYTIVGTVDAPDMDTFTDETDLTPGTTYAYTVTAFDRQSESVPTGPIVAILLAAPSVTPVSAAPTPLPTFAAVTAPTITAVAHLPQSAGTSAALSTASPIVGVPTTIPTTAATTPSPIPTVSQNRPVPVATATRTP